MPARLGEQGEEHGTWCGGKEWKEGERWAGAGLGEIENGGERWAGAGLRGDREWGGKVGWGRAEGR